MADTTEHDGFTQFERTIVEGEKEAAKAAEKAARAKKAKAKKAEAKKAEK